MGAALRVGPGVLNKEELWLELELLAAEGAVVRVVRGVCSGVFTRFLACKRLRREGGTIAVVAGVVVGARESRDLPNANFPGATLGAAAAELEKEDGLELESDERVLPATEEAAVEACFCLNAGGADR